MADKKDQVPEDVPDWLKPDSSATRLDLKNRIKSRLLLPPVPSKTKSMPEWGEGVKHFMAYWFSGLMNGLESVDKPARKAILRECGKACAQSYTAQVFQEARKHSADAVQLVALSWLR